MILALFTAFMMLAIIAVVLGYYTGDTFYAFVGLFILFSLSLVIVSGNMEYKTGATYNDTHVVDTYASYNDTTSHWVGYTLAVATGFGMFLLLANYRNKRSDEE